MEYLVITLIALVAGSLAGNAINVLTTRLPADLPIAGPPLRSADGTPSQQQMVPLFGALRERDGIDWPNLATQIGAIALTAAAFLFHGISLTAIQTTIMSLVLLIILRIDWQHHAIFIITIWPGILLALFFALLDSPASLASAAIAGTLAAFVFLLLFFLAIAIYRKRALGFGDVLLAGLIGAMAGLDSVTLAIMLGMVLAAVGGLFLVAIRVKKRTDYIPYGAYLSLGAMVVVLATA